MRKFINILIASLFFTFLLSPDPTFAADCSFSINRSSINFDNKDVTVTLIDAIPNTTYKAEVRTSLGVLRYQDTTKTGNFSEGFKPQFSLPLYSNDIPDGDYTLRITGPTGLCSPTAGVPLTIDGPNRTDDDEGGGGTPPPSKGLSGVDDPLKGRFETVGQIITEILPYIYGFAAMLALLYLVWGGFRYLTSRGDPKAIDAARGTITSAVIGLAIILLVGLIYYFIGLVFRINIFGGSSLGLVSTAFAQETREGLPIGCAIKLADNKCITEVFPTVGSFFSAILRFALVAAAGAFFVMLMWGGFRYMNAGGNQDNAQAARQTITNAGIGLVIIVVSFVIIEIITRAVGAGSILSR